jgi:predicted transcriptional regulator
MNFANDNQRRAVCASYNNFAKGSSKLRDVEYLTKKIKPMLRDDMDIQTIDTYAMHDSGLTRNENLGEVIADLRERGLLKPLGDVPSKAEDAKLLVSEIVFKNRTMEDVYNSIKDDKYMMTRFRNEMLRAIYGNVLKEDDPAVQYLAEYDKTFEEYLENMIKSRDMPAAQLVTTVSNIEASGPIMEQVIKMKHNPRQFVMPEVEYVYET